MNAVAVIQSRMSSTRLPGKVLMGIEGKPVILRVFERVGKAKSVDKVIVATSADKSDDELAAYCVRREIPVFRGSLDDVLDRFYQAAKSENADVVVRITADCPLNDPALIDEYVNLFKSRGYDYVTNSEEPWMDGFEVWVFSFAALEAAWKNAKMASEREHVTPYIKAHAKRPFFERNDPRLEKVHCSVDNSKDLEFVRALYKRLLKGKEDSFGYLDVISVLEKEPELLKINSDSVINEGYAKSLREDKKVR